MQQRDDDCLQELEEILTFCGYVGDRIERYGITGQSIADNPDHADLILMPICQIGEIVQKPRDTLEDLYPEVEWHKISGIRNVIVHGYTKVDAALVYSTAENDIPELAKFCNEKKARLS